jgi:NAD(P)-dependent dehydrogenase (short-subunit alcohol dehydrogenase family)
VNLFKTAFEKFGKIDILVTSAGILDYNASILKTERYLWDRMIAVNQTGLFYCCREALKYMEKQGSGSIVNISSVAGISGNAGFSYSASKHAVVALTKNIAIQYTGTNIRCNVICPGPVNTPMSNPSQEVLKQAEAYYDAGFMEICGRHINKTPGFSDPIDQANVILFFASDMSSAITGQWLQVDKGFY